MRTLASFRQQFVNLCVVASSFIMQLNSMHKRFSGSNESSQVVFVC